MAEQVRCEIREMSRNNLLTLGPVGETLGIYYTNGALDTSITIGLLIDSEQLIGKRATDAKLYIQGTYSYGGVSVVQPLGASIWASGFFQSDYQSLIGENYNLLPTVGSNSDFVDVKIETSSWQWRSGGFKEGNNNVGRFVSYGGLFIFHCGSPVYPYENTAWASATIRTVNSDYPPYLIVTVEDDLIYYAGNLSSGEVVNPRDSVRFSWDYIPDPGNIRDHMNNGNVPQTGSLFRYRKAGETNYTEIDIPGQSNSYNMPAETLADFTDYEWSVAVYNAEAVFEPIEWASITTTDKIPVCEIQKPKNTYVENSIDNEMLWTYTVSTGLPQYAFDAQYSEDLSKWVTFANHIVQENTDYIIPAGTLPSGKIWLRIRGYNVNDVAGGWSESVQLISLGAPDPPVVRVDTISPRPQISWSSDDQAGYEVIIGSHESGVLAGTQRSYKVPEYLPDGTVTAMVRISNEYGYWSDWGSVTITIQNAPLHAVTLYADESRGPSARLWWGGSGTMNYIYKDGELIGKTAESSFEDVMANGAATYQIMATAGDNYVRSSEVKAFVDVRGGLLAGADGKWFDVGTRFGNAPELAQSDIANVTYIQYAGRDFPVAEIGAGRTRTLAFECAFRSGDPRIRQIEQLTGRQVLYKDENGLAVKGVLETVDWIKTRRMAAASCVIVQLDGTEVIEYDL